ncbi:hypothetical protein BLNAU_8310 [Blattamonas nauphoetae]|uniref:Uncharacterized protein n=1 Tax=Blattamonas nauphoetae TaxID=2049346 RepID=A0ABQ9XYX8_9EUKA|nr:hypothetical protein BLNAU_8310 [Blattamonas nauphoetae]
MPLVQCLFQPEYILPVYNRQNIYSRLFHESEDITGLNRTFIDCYFDTITNEGSFGAIYIEGDEGILTIQRCMFEKCVSSNGYGGGVFANLDSCFSMTETTFNACESVIGGAVCTDVTIHLTISNCNASKCLGVNSGGYCLCGSRKTTVVSNCYIGQCNASYICGGIWFQAPQKVYLSSTLFFECKAAYYGGGLVVADPMFDEHPSTQSESNGEGQEARERDRRIWSRRHGLGKVMKSALQQKHSHSSTICHPPPRPSTLGPNTDRYYPVICSSLIFVGCLAGTCTYCNASNYGNAVYFDSYVADAFPWDTLPEFFITPDEPAAILGAGLEDAEKELIPGRFSAFNENFVSVVNGSHASCSAAPCGTQLNPCCRLSQAINIANPYVKRTMHLINVWGSSDSSSFQIQGKNAVVSGADSASICWTTADSSSPLIHLTNSRVTMKDFRFVLFHSSSGGSSQISNSLVQVSSESTFIAHRFSLMTTSTLAIKFSVPLFVCADGSLEIGEFSCHFGSGSTDSFPTGSQLSDCSIVNFVKGISILEHASFSSIQRTTGNGAIVSGTVSSSFASEARTGSSLHIRYCSFTSVETLDGRGGVVGLTVIDSGMFKLSHSSFTQCKATQTSPLSKGGCVFLQCQWTSAQNVQSNAALGENDYGNFIFDALQFNSNQAAEGTEIFVLAPNLPRMVANSKFHFSTSIEDGFNPINSIIGATSESSIRENLITLMANKEKILFTTSPPGPPGADPVVYTCGDESDPCPSLSFAADVILYYSGFDSIDEAVNQNTRTIKIVSNAAILHSCEFGSVQIQSEDMKNKNTAILTLSSLSSAPLSNSYLIRIRKASSFDFIVFSIPRSVSTSAGTGSAMLLIDKRCSFNFCSIAPSESGTLLDPFISSAVMLTWVNMTAGAESEMDQNIINSTFSSLILSSGSSFIRAMPLTSLSLTDVVFLSIRAPHGSQLFILTGRIVEEISRSYAYCTNCTFHMQKETNGGVLARLTDMTFRFTDCEITGLSSATSTHSNVPELSTACHNSQPNTECSMCNFYVEPTCYWDDALVISTGTTLYIRTSKIGNLHSPVISTKDGIVSIDDTAIYGNGKFDDPSFANFPSVCRNFLCDNSTMTSWSMYFTEEKDEYVGQYTSMWLYEQDCTLSSRFSTPRHPTFVPQLDTIEVSETTQTSDNGYTVILKGKVILPCSVSMQITERVSKKVHNINMTTFTDETTAVGFVPFSLIPKTTKASLVFVSTIINISLSASTSLGVTDGPSIIEPEDPEDPTPPKFDSSIIIIVMSSVVSFLLCVMLVLIVIFVIRYLELSDLRKAKKETTEPRQIRVQAAVPPPAPVIEEMAPVEDPVPQVAEPTNEEAPAPTFSYEYHLLDSEDESVHDEEGEEKSYPEGNDILE